MSNVYFLCGLVWCLNFNFARFFFHFEMKFSSCFCKSISNLRIFVNPLLPTALEGAVDID